MHPLKNVTFSAAVYFPTRFSTFHWKHFNLQLLDSEYLGGQLL